MDHNFVDQIIIGRKQSEQKTDVMSVDFKNWTKCLDEKLWKNTMKSTSNAVLLTIYFNAVNKMYQRHRVTN